MGRTNATRSGSATRAERNASRSRSAAAPPRHEPHSPSGADAAQPGSTNGDVAWLTIRGARQHNLRNVDVAIPLGRFVCVTGVSGSGKSSLVNDILYRELARRLHRATALDPGEHAGIDGVEHLDKIIAIDQSPIGRTPRSNPATYIKLFDEIRDLFTRLPDAKLRGYKPGRFSFNVAAGRKGGGRCEACEGNGANRIEMDFLADVWVRCPVCDGKRFGRETLQIQYKGKSIADVLEMDVQQALEHFDSQHRIRGMLQTLHDVGLDYLKLGQSSATLSGGEAQRIKLARELVRKPTGRTLYVLDEPTTGLHFEDIRRLLVVLHGFVDGGNTVVVIEHNLDVVKTADWIIDLGPEGGEDGGEIVVAGAPEQVAACAASHTGVALRAVLSTTRTSSLAAAEARRTTSPDRAIRRDARAADVVLVRGARQHNLRDLTVSFPRGKTTVCTGVSGSGKTSFAIDTVFTEGYRRYVESLSAYARQFLGQLAKPRVDHVEGLSPAICIEQKSASKSPRSTVGTITEVYDYMRVLWARLATPHCPNCQIPIGTQTADEIVARVMALEAGAPIIILAPVALGEGESYNALFNRLRNSGYARVRVDGEVVPTAHAITLDARRRHRVDVVVDRTIVKAKSRSRIADSIEHALALGNGVVGVLVEAVERVTDPGAAGTTGGRADGRTAERPDAGNGKPGPGGTEAEDVGSSAAANPAARREQPTPDTNAQSESDSPPTTAVSPERELRFSQNFACLRCGESFDELAPHHFSFNSQLGWCDTCEGLGVQRGAPPGTIITDPDKSLVDGAIDGWRRIDPRSPLGKLLAALCASLGVAPTTPLGDWSAAQKRALMFGTVGEWIDGSAAFPSHDAPTGLASAKSAGAKHHAKSAVIGGPARRPAGLRFHWRGFFPAIDAATRNSWSFRHRLRNVVAEIPCTSCRGGRLRGFPAAARLGGRTIVEVCDLPLAQCRAFFDELKLTVNERKVAGELLKEVRDRLQFLVDVGLDYLTLHRAAPTLSGGEAQRIRLASQIGGGLAGVLYVLDEPTIGLHPRDTGRLVRALVKLRDLGNTLLLVEHDRDVIRGADHILDFGPRAGAFGGRIVAEGPIAHIAGASGRADADESLTRAYLAGTNAVTVPTNRRPVDAWRDPGRAPTTTGGDRAARPRRLRSGHAAAPDGASPGWLVIRGARQNNLRNVDVPVPLARLVCVTGVSGSGKSSLVNDILWPALARDLQNSTLAPGEHDAVEFFQRVATDGGVTLARSAAGLIERVSNVDQSPIGATPSSNPATYTGVFDWVRELFARLPDSKARGYNANRFSFNRPGGRCEACEGFGQKRIEMHFMPDVWIECENCRGKRYSADTLDVRFKGRSIADVLELRVNAALELFENVPRIRRMLQTLADVGLDYVQLGQSATTLSGGEAQRVKLAAELGKPDTGRTLYILDEPTTGLHFDDVKKLLAVLHRLVDLGNTIVVVEHNLDVIKSCDWMIDLGPEAGEGGGCVVASGTPEDVVRALRALPIAECAARGADAGPQPRAELGRTTAAGVRSTSCAPHPGFRSHTAVALAPVLAAGPHAAREVFDPVAYAERTLAIERAGLGKIGREVRVPWQIDGRKWHLEQRPSRDGKPVRWEPAALEYVEQLIQRSGRFAPTRWNNRASVEIAAAGADEWFFHALTGGEWLLALYFHVPRGRFEASKLNAQLRLPTLDERGDLQTYGDWARVDVRKHLGGVDAVAIHVHDRKEIDTPAFRRFVKDAAAAYLQHVAKP
ncbi:MAG: ATP-binding cassette domain-containing protein [Phycisphaerae bacterium]